MGNVKHINLFGKALDIPVPLTSEQATQMQEKSYLTIKV